MSARSVIPFGPQHPVLPEPIHLDLVMEDERVVEAIPSIGFIHRGLEKLVEKKDFQEMVAQDYSFFLLLQNLPPIIPIFHSHLYLLRLK